MQNSHLGCTVLQPLGQVLLGNSSYSEEIHLGPMHLKLVGCGRTAREVSLGADNDQRSMLKNGKILEKVIFFLNSEVS